MSSSSTSPLPPFIREWAVDRNGGRGLVISLVAAFVLLLPFTYLCRESHLSQLQKEEITELGISNSTLGFEQLVVVTTGPSWRLSGLQTAAAFTGLNLAAPKQPDWSEEEVNVFRQKKKSSSVGSARHKNEYGIGPGQARCWLGHLNALRYVLENGWATALIMEDDADWDINLKEQMQLVAPMIRELTTATSNSSSPYGDSWDILWLGHSGDPIDFKEGRFKATIDQTLPESTIYRHVYGGRSYFPPKLRVVHYSVAPLCTFAYAVTRAAALKIYALSRGGQDRIITMMLRKWCTHGMLRCVTVNPELFHHHKRADEVASHIAMVEGWTERAAPAELTYTANIRYSARCNSDSTTLVTCQSDWESDQWR